jgi:hypothetical protein
MRESPLPPTGLPFDSQGNCTKLVIEQRQEFPGVFAHEGIIFRAGREPFPCLEKAFDQVFCVFLEHIHAEIHDRARFEIALLGVLQVDAVEIMPQIAPREVVLFLQGIAHALPPDQAVPAPVPVDRRRNAVRNLVCPGYDCQRLKHCGWSLSLALGAMTPLQVKPSANDNGDSSGNHVGGPRCVAYLMKYMRGMSISVRTGGIRGEEIRREPSGPASSSALPAQANSPMAIQSHQTE